MSFNFSFKQHRGWQLNKACQTADSMCALGYFLPSETILTVQGEKADSNLEVTLKAAGMEPTKVYHIGQNKMVGEAIMAMAAAEDAKAKKGGCKVICDGNHKALGVWLAATVGKVTVVPITAEVKPELAERIAHEANLGHQTAAALANDEKLASIVTLRRAGVYKKQSDLPFGANDRGNHQNYWWRSEAVIIKGYEPEKVSKLKWQICKRLVEGVPFDQAILEAAKKNEEKVITAETIKMGATMARNADPDGANPITLILECAAKGDNDGYKERISKLYAALKPQATVPTNDVG